jgi:hypothetical protein
MTIDFSKLGKTQMGTVPPPPVAPAGTMYGTIIRWAWAESRWRNKETNQTEAQVHFTIKPTEFGEDITEEDKAGIVLKDKVFVAEQGCNSDAQIYYMQEFLASLGIAVAGKTLDQCLPETIGTSVMFEVVHKTGERGTIANVRKLRARVQ